MHVVCSDERAALYEAVAGSAKLALRIVPTVGEAVRGCVSEPGRAVLIDMVTTLHSGVSETAPLYNLGIDLPILRCSQSEAGDWTAMCQAPFKRVPLLVALEEIAGKEVSWRHPVYSRRFVRVPLLSRVRIRRESNDSWIRANCSNASISGMFILTLESFPIGSELDLEVLDVGSANGRMRGMVTWQHSWDDGPHLPGLGLDFDMRSVDPTFRKFLAEVYVNKRA